MFGDRYIGLGLHRLIQVFTSISMTEVDLENANARVQRAIADLYLQFKVPIPSVIEGCPCCIESRGVDVLLKTPLRELSGQDLWRYVSGVFLTIGSEADFRYLLPRILDVSVNDWSNSNDPEIVLSKFGMVKWDTWPVGQKQAVTEFINSWFELVLAHQILDEDSRWIPVQVDNLICGAARAGILLEPFLTRLQEPDAQSVLEDLRANSPEGLTAFWDFAPEGLVQFRQLIG